MARYLMQALSPSKDAYHDLVQGRTRPQQETALDGTARDVDESAFFRDEASGLDIVPCRDGKRV
jgi:hypothetical protein